MPNNNGIIPNNVAIVRNNIVDFIRNGGSQSERENLGAIHTGCMSLLA